MVTTLRTSQSMELQSYCLLNWVSLLRYLVLVLRKVMLLLFTETFNNITTVGASTQGVVLPTAAAGLTVIVANTTTSNCKLYPATSDTIEGGSNAAVTLPAKTTFTLTCKDATDWTKHRGLAVYNSSATLIN